MIYTHASVRKGRGGGRPAASFRLRHNKAMIGLRALLFAVLLVCRSGRVEAVEDLDAVWEFQSHMAYLMEDADKEGDIRLSEHGSDAFAVAMCKSQNLVEHGKFAEAASVLSGLTADRIPADQRQTLATRARILEKWSQTGAVELEDYRQVYLETAPSWSRTRTRPIVALWQDRRLSDKDKYLLLASLLERKGDLRGQALAFVVMPILPSVDEETSARALLAAGNAFHKSGDRERAEQAWRRTSQYPHVASVWAKAVFNLGLLEVERRNFARGLVYFDEVLKSRPNDKEPGGNIMEAYRNYSHRCALEISKCYEGIGDYHEALRYAWLAKKRYPYLSWCGTCVRSANWALNRRIAYLAMRVPELNAAAATILVAGVIYWRRGRRKERKTRPKAPLDEYHL